MRACDDVGIPSQDRIDAIVDEADLEEVHYTERRVLCGACTRARYLLIAATELGSGFLDDLRTSQRSTADFAGRSL